MRDSYYDVLKGMSELVDSCENRFGKMSGKKVLDISCHDGELLNIFKKKGAVAIGCGSKSKCPNVDMEDIMLLNEDISEQVVDKIASLYGKMDFITTTAYVEDIHLCFERIKKIIGSQTVVVIENHYLEPIDPRLDDKQFDIFYDEFPKTYRYESFSKIADICYAKFIDIEFPAHFIGNIRVFLWDAVASNILGRFIGEKDLSFKIM